MGMRVIYVDDDDIDDMLMQCKRFVLERIIADILQERGIDVTDNPDAYQGVMEDMTDWLYDIGA